MRKLFKESSHKFEMAVLLIALAGLAIVFVIGVTIALTHREAAAPSDAPELLLEPESGASLQTG